MSNDRSEAIDIIAQHGSFLLVRSGSRFGVVEKRAGRIYPMKPGEREGMPMTTAGIASIIEENALVEADAKRFFEELCQRGDGLAQRLW